MRSVNLEVDTYAACQTPRTKIDIRHYAVITLEGENMADGGKTKVIAGLLGLFLGWAGVHHFYLGSTMSGVICLLTCGCCGLTLVESVMLLIMSDEDFDAKYNARTPESMEFVFMNPHK